MAASKDLPIELAAFKPRERILAAALKLFVEQGYFNTNVPDLSRESKCSVGSIYHTFRNKEEVARALYYEGIRAFRDAMLSCLRSARSPEEAVREIVRSFLLFSEINIQLSKYIWLCRHNEFMSGLIRHPTMVGFDELGRQLTAHLKGGIRDGILRDLDAHLIWSILFGTPLAYVRDWLEGYNTKKPSEVITPLADACWRALRT
jgi:TetR/AcrR family transcriptional regulator, repressor of fatR-cypB operon